MPEPIQTEQESRSAQVSYRVTKAEKRAVVLVAAHRDVPESDLLRTVLIADIVAEHARLFPRAEVSEPSEQVA